MTVRKCNRCGGRIFDVEATSGSGSMMGFQVPQCISCGYEDYSSISLGGPGSRVEVLQPVTTDVTEVESPARKKTKAA